MNQHTGTDRSGGRHHTQRPAVAGSRREPASPRRKRPVPATGAVAGAGRRALAAATALAALAASVALLAGTPLLMARLVGWPLPHHLPTRADLGDALTGPLSQQLLVGVLGCLFWYAWLALAVGYVTELAARLTGRPRPHLPSFGPGQALAAALITTIAAGFLTAALRTPRPAGTLDVQLAAHHLSTPAATAPAVAGTTTAVNPGPVTSQALFPPPADEYQAANAAKARTGPLPTCVVDRYDTLWGLAERHLGDPLRWQQIYTLNQGLPQPDGGQLDDPDLIRPGWILRLPADATHLDDAEAPTPPHQGDASTPPPTPTQPSPQTPSTPAPSTTTPSPAAEIPPQGQSTPGQPGSSTPADPPSPASPGAASSLPAEPAPSTPVPWTPTLTPSAATPTPNGTPPPIPTPRPPTTPARAASTTPDTAPGDHGDGHIHLPSGAVLPLSTVAAVAAAVTAARLLRSRRWRFPPPPDQPRPAEPPLPLVVREILRAHRPPGDDPPPGHRHDAPTGPTPAGPGANDEPALGQPPSGTAPRPPAGPGPTARPPRRTEASSPPGHTPVPAASTDTLHRAGGPAPGHAASPATAVLPTGPPTPPPDTRRDQPPSPAPAVAVPYGEADMPAAPWPGPLPDQLTDTGTLALDGPGAPAAVRALLVALLVDHHRHRGLPRPWPAQLIIPAEAARRLDLATGTLATLPQVTVTTDGSAVLDRCETEALHRQRALAEYAATSLTELHAAAPDEAFPVVLAVLDQPTTPALAARLAALAHSGARLGLHTLLLGPAPGAITLRADGHPTSPPDQTGTSWPKLTPDQAADLLTLTLAAHDLHPAAAATATASAAPVPPQDTAPQPADTAHPAPPVPRDADPATPAAGLRVRFTVFGRPALTIDHRPHSAGLSARSLEIAAYLALHTGGVTGDQLAAELLPDRDPTRARNAIYQDIAKLRAAIRHATGEPATHYLAGDKKTGYRLNPDHVAVDLWDFHHAMAAAGQARDDPDRIAALTAASLLVAARPFGDTAYEWSAAPAADLEHRALAALVDLADLHADDQPDQALTHLEHAISLAPQVEDLYAHMMRIHATRNRPDAVRRTYQRLVDALDHLGLDVDPTPETQNLLARLLRHPTPPR